MNLNVIDKIKSSIKKLTQEQKKIIYLGIIILFSLFFFWFFIYAPQGKKLALIKNSLRQADTQIAQIHSIIAGRDLAQAVIELKTSLNESTGKLPSDEEGIIDSLSKNARKLNIEIKNIVPSGKRSLADKIPGYAIAELPISLNLVCEFKALGEYLHILSHKLPVLIHLRQLDIKGKGEGRTDLDIALSVLAYLSKEKD